MVKNIFMRYIVVVLLLSLSVTYASAQEVYSSSGKPGYYKKTKKKTGYDPDRLIVGGGINGGINGDYINAGLAPFVGYRITKAFSAGVGMGYQYYRFPDYVDQNNRVYYGTMNIFYPNIWTRCFLYRNLFVDATYEYDFINLKSSLDNFGNLDPTRSQVTNSCLLLGAGLRFPVSGRVSFYGELFYDVLQGRYTPYPYPDLKFGVAAGL